MINVVVMSLLDDGHLEDDALYDCESDMQEIAADYRQNVSFTYYDHILSGMQLEEMLGKSWESLMSSNSNAFSELIFLAGESFDAFIDDPMMQAMALDDLEYVVENLEILLKRYRARYIWQHAKLYFRELDISHDDAYTEDFQALKKRLQTLFGDAFYSYSVKERGGQLRLDRHFSRQITDVFAADVEEVCGSYAHHDERTMDKAVNLKQLSSRLQVTLNADEKQALKNKPLSRYTIYQYIALQLSRLGYAVADLSDQIEKSGYALLKKAARSYDASIMPSLALIASTRQGLRYDDLRVLLAEQGTSFDPDMMKRFVDDYFELFSYHGDALDLMFNIKSAFPEDYTQDILEYLYALDARDELRRDELTYYIIKCHDHVKMIQTIVQAKEQGDRDALDAISEALYLQSVKDRGAWLTDMIKTAYQCDTAQRMTTLSFIFGEFDYDYKRLLATSRQHGYALLQLTKALYELAGTVRADRHESRVLLSWAYDFLGDSCRFYEASYELGVACYLEAVKVKKDLMAAEGSSDEVLNSLALTYRDLAESYRQLGDEDHVKTYTALSEQMGTQS